MTKVSASRYRYELVFIVDSCISHMPGQQLKLLQLLHIYSILRCRWSQPQCMLSSRAYFANTLGTGHTRARSVLSGRIPRAVAVCGETFLGELCL